ncbi:MAG: hypothetical protein K2H83_00145 [Duncaniella sp.]|nr:hypothetical protein [Duncaniella sp.]MDE5733536.1 hypothetical protein [Duncaniella sp.]MDE6177731.1 hypothetical protein [Duncaniella sp.]MDE6389931.1 hypothetical protein [Duncaniella sp.]
MGESPDAARLYPPRLESSRLLAMCLPGDYSASRIARAVEDADAQLLNLNITSDTLEVENRIVFELRVSHRSPLAVARSLERYGYEVADLIGAGGESVDERLSDRVASLIRLLEV